MENSRYVHAKDLKIGDKLQWHDGRKFTVTDVREADGHTYFTLEGDGPAFESAGFESALEKDYWKKCLGETE